MELQWATITLSCLVELAQKSFLIFHPISFSTSLASNFSIPSEFSPCPLDSMHATTLELQLIMTLFSTCTILPQGPWVITLSVPRLCSQHPLTLCFPGAPSTPASPNSWLETSYHDFLCYCVFWLKRQFRSREVKGKMKNRDHFYLYITRYASLLRSFDKCETFWGCHYFSFTKERKFHG